MRSRIGVYICHCGSNIGGYLDVRQVTEFAASLDSVVVARHYTFMCSDPGQDLIKNDIKELELNGVLVCSCSPTLHLRTFREACQDAGLNPHLCEMASIRENCSWVHSHDSHLATEKAMGLVAAGVSRVKHRLPLETKWAPVNTSTLVVGGGVAGIQASLEIAASGNRVYLVEREPSLGGRMAQLGRTFPNLDSAVDILSPRIDEAVSNEYVEVFTDSQVEEVAGYVGNFKARIKKKAIELNGEGKTIEVEIGAIIVATGYDVFDPTPIAQYGYGRLDNVVTSLEFERMLSADGPTGGNVTLKDGSTPGSVAIVHCVGSRDENYHAYCSRICCTYGLKYAHLLRDETGAEVYQMYIDMRCFGKGQEEFYKRAREAGASFIRGKVAQVTDITLPEEEKGKLIVVGEDTLLGAIIRVPVDMVILNVAMEPRADADEVARTFLLGRSADGFFLEKHPKLDPVGTMLDGVYAVGCCQGPKDITDTVAQATGAAARAIALISKGKVEMEAATAVVDEEVCSGCGYCEAVCVYSAIEINPRTKLAVVNEALCKGCGACTVNCPSKAMQLKNFGAKQIIDMINTATEEYAGLAR